MSTRFAKILLLSGTAFYLTLIVFNNLTDFGTNYEFVRHVLAMDSTIPGNHSQWRALTSPAIHLALYWGIIAWELASAILLWLGAVNLTRNLREPALLFNSAKRLAILALTLSLLMWLVAFLAVGGEWYLMWQSQWNGQQAALRMFTVFGIVLVVLLQPDIESQP